MPSGIHLTAEDLAEWPKSKLGYHLQFAYHLTEACPDCWGTIHSAQLGEPHRHGEPFLRALARIRLQPKVDLSVPSQALRPLAVEPFRPSDFPMLLLQESIALALERGHGGPLVSFLFVPMKLGEFLGTLPEMETVGTELSVNVHCAFVDLFLQHRERAAAEVSLQAAKGQVHDGCDAVTRAHVLLAEFLWACGSGDKKAAVECADRLTGEGWPLLVADPVRRFEISCEVVRGLARVGSADPARNAAWPLSELEVGEFGHLLHRLNGLFHKARYATAVAAEIPGLAPTVAMELESAFASVKAHGDLYSLALYHQLRGELDGDETAFDDALDIFSALELERPFFDAWRKLDGWLVATNSPDLAERRHHLSKHAMAVFGKDVALRRIKAMPWCKGEAGIEYRPVEGPSARRIAF